MLGQRDSKKICEDVLRRAGSDPAEILLFFEDQSLTRFTHNHIHQNVAERNITLIIRLFRGKRIGLATTNRLDEEGLDRMVERARANAEISPEDPDYPGLPEPANYAIVEAFDQATADYTPHERAKAVGTVCRLTSERGLSGSGVFSTGTNEIAIANTQGVFAHHASTNADFQILVTSEDASGREQDVWRLR